LGNVPAVFPAAITQQLLNDPITLLQETIQKQVAEGCTFEGTAINIATQTPITFFTTAPTAPPAGGPTVNVNVADSSGGIGNLPFLITNADSALVYATFWIEKVTPKIGLHFHATPIRPVCLFEFSGSSRPVNGGAARFGPGETQFQLATCLRCDTSEDLRMIVELLGPTFICPTVDMKSAYSRNSAPLHS
jgi:hypothetical protein